MRRRPALPTLWHPRNPRFFWSCLRVLLPPNIISDLLFENLKRQRSILQHSVVELTLDRIFLPALSQREPGVLESLTFRSCTHRPDLARRYIVQFRILLLFAHPCFLTHVGDRLFARPTLRMNASIDDQSHCAEKLVTHASEIAEWIFVVPTGSFGQPFAVKGPAFYLGSKRNDLSKLRKAFEFFYC